VSTGEPNSLRRRRRTATATEISKPKFRNPESRATSRRLCDQYGVDPKNDNKLIPTFFSSRTINFDFRFF
jgi:hypothetical protein